MSKQTDLIKQVANQDKDAKSILDQKKLETLLEKKERRDSEVFFQRVLHLDPLEIPKLYDGIKIKDGSPYIPISFVEMLLDEIFFGQWKTHSFHGQQIMNEVVGWITLEVKHPVTGEWIQRVGASAKQIQQKSKTPIIEIAEHKYGNALEKVFPAMKSEAIKNASKSLGKLFGRDLGRKEDQQSPYEPLIGDERGAKVKQDLDDLLRGGAPENQNLEPTEPTNERR